MARRPDIEPVTKERILRVAAEHMTQRGYRGTNLNEIAARLGVTRQALYYHFPNKQAILQAIFESLFVNLHQSAESLRGTPDELRFRTMFSAYIDVILNDIAVAGVAVNELRELPTGEREHIFAMRRKYIEILENAYSAGVACGRLVDIPAPMAVRIAIGAANWATRSLRIDGKYNREQVRGFIEDVVFDGVVIASGVTANVHQV